MNAKNLLSMVLLLFVGAAIVVLIVREVGSDAAQTAPVVEEDVSLPTTGLVAYYFHGETRCPTCRNIEAYAHEAIQGSFPAELSSGEVAWRVVNTVPPKVYALDAGTDVGVGRYVPSGTDPN